MDQDRLGRLTGTATVPVHATSTAGGTQRERPRRPVPKTSSSPRSSQRLLPSHDTVPKRRANVQGGARRRGQRASGHRDQVGLAARNERVGALSGRCPPQGAPKRDRPRAKTPMNRRKSPRRRRAAPIANRGRSGRQGSGLGMLVSGMDYAICAESWGLSDRET